MSRNTHRKPDPDYYKWIGGNYDDKFQEKHKGFIDHNFTKTEPLNEQPTHSKIIHLAKVEMITEAFFVKLRVDVLRNSIRGWVIGTPLPGITDYDQPLGDRWP